MLQPIASLLISQIEVWGEASGGPLFFAPSPMQNPLRYVPFCSHPFKAVPCTSGTISAVISLATNPDHRVSTYDLDLNFAKAWGGGSGGLSLHPLQNPLRHVQSDPAYPRLLSLQCPGAPMEEAGLAALRWPPSGAGARHRKPLLKTPNPPK